jgi:hypothetical protein
MARKAAPNLSGVPWIQARCWASVESFAGSRIEPGLFLPYCSDMGTTSMFDPLIGNGAPVLKTLGTDPGKPAVE